MHVTETSIRSLQHLGYYSELKTSIPNGSSDGKSRELSTSNLLSFAWLASNVVQRYMTLTLLGV